MFGLAVYWFVSFGLGGLVYKFLIREPAMPGVAFGVGAMLPILVYPSLHLVLGLSLTAAAYATVGVAAVGVLLWCLDLRKTGVAVAAHPMLLLPAIALLVIGLLGRGALDYLPYTTDEFSNWIGISRNIYMLGDFASVRNDLWLHGYTPGWRLWMLFPWMLSGEMEYGLSATAPLLMHIGAVCVLFDFLRRGLSDTYPEDARIAWIGAWTVIGLLLAGEGMGKLWSYTLLIEPPQIYAATVLLGLLMVAERRHIKSDWPVLLTIGLVAAAGYFVKSAGLLFILAAAAAAVLHHWRSGSLWSYKSGLTLLLVAGPGLVANVAWSSGVSASDSCVVNPISTLLAGGGASEGLAIWDTLAYRFVDQTGGYILSYKWPLTAVAAAGWIYAIATGSWRAFAVLAFFSLAYFGALYVFHVLCFGPFYFETLNSIPRFTRVALQPFQAAGFVWAALLGFAILRRLVGQGVTAERVRRPAVLVGGLLVAVLAAFQAYQLEMSRRDVTTRALQNVDTRIAEAHALVEAVEENVTRPPDRKVRVLSIDQQGDWTHSYYAYYFASRVVDGKIEWFVNFGDKHSWPMSADATAVERNAVVSGFLSAARSSDIIWPLLMDTWQVEALSTLAGADCDLRSGDFYAYRTDQPTPYPFVCTRKPPRVSSWSP